MDSYKVGTGGQQIRLAVDITSNGIATTRGFLITSTDRFPISGCASKDATGDIIQMPIGSAASLKGNKLLIVTNILLFWPDKETRKIEFEKITARYVMDDGKDGHKEFPEADLKIDALDDFTDIWLHKTIKLS
ncbi:hypothetical protein [Chitinophaga barathri]|uniref:Uncharacterized protein n=1 Tax=Chitinophaga barathri TaxID=1647451 RepID=A0A3N4MBB0_9BACT|nr:hypothetical protein [Chitinophaga barathri]RPD38707.1 hypothetical protein EG028_23655 [Chitinophaga barathri]